ncbi:MAG TPA: multiheme c-type cytochrome [Blastocatellia bacterium]|nr:multiheme c-type cytochrome [Blastocatellia bacterium]
MNSGVKKALSCTAAMLYLLILAGGTWATSAIFPQANRAARWHPRRVQAGTTFVGDQVCANCHKNKVASHSQTGMAMAMESVADSKVLTQNPTMTFRTGPYTYEIKRRDGQSFYTISDGKETISLPILYAFGQGKAGQTYVLQYEGSFYESLVSFYKEVQGLDFTIGAPRSVPPSLKQAIGRRLSDNEVLNCFSCHATGGVEGGKINLQKVTLGIRCEACHGPGAKHVAASEAGEPSAGLIFNPGRLSGDELTQDFCASCHRGNDEFSLLRSMEINNVRFQPYRIFHSKCYSDDRRISCTACHDAHEPLRQSADYYDKKCLACHTSKEKAAEPETKQESQTMVAGCRVGTKDCVSCHMPKIGPPAAHFKFTDHYIRVVKVGEAYPN